MDIGYIILLMKLDSAHIAYGSCKFGIMIITNKYDDTCK